VSTDIVAALKYVAYYRVSTKRQGRSGLGLEAQRKAVQAMAEKYGAAIIAEYIEVETGKSAKRPKLLEAIHHAGLTNATLVVAKLDRLARNAWFTRTLKESKQPFICCDNPGASDLTIDLLAVIAEHEARAIATRTREALAIAREHGTLLGSARPGHWNGREDRRAFGQKKSQPLASASNSHRARDRYHAILVPEIKRRREAGESLVAITAWLNEQGFRTRPTKRCPQGGVFTPMMVWRLIHRYLGEELLGNVTTKVPPACAAYN
jgi:DNA invertase Pin-like site-specific DNA recombinase